MNEIIFIHILNIYTKPYVIIVENVLQQRTKSLTDPSIFFF